MKKVSIIIPCFNQGEWIKEAVESAVNQTYKNVEIVIINDGSTDNSEDVIHSLCEKYPDIVFINEKENHGVVYARNKAIQMTSAEYILPLDADDKIAPSYVEKAVKILEENPNIGIVYSRARIFGIKNKEWKLAEFSREDILYKNCIFSSALFRKRDFEKIGGYKEYMKDGWEDWDLWLSFIEAGFEVHRIDEVLFFYRKYKQASRSDLLKNKDLMLYSNIFKHHLNLYLNSDNFIKRVYNQSDKKFKQYNKLYYLSLFGFIISFYINLIFLINQILNK